MRISSLRLLAVASLAWVAMAGALAAQLPEGSATPAAVMPLVSHEKLIPFLPEPPEGWGAEAATGSTTDTEEIRMSTARRSYFRKGDGDDLPSAVVTIIDSATNSDLFDSASEKWLHETESEEGFDKRVVIDGMRALEHYSKPAKTGSLSVFVGGHYFVQIELTNVDPSALRDWLKQIDVKKLAALK